MEFYVYILMDDRYAGNYPNSYGELNYKPFYVGKGCNNCINKSERHLSHFKENLNDCKKNSNPHKCRVIKKLIKEGYKPNFKILYKSHNENDVFMVEKELINFYGKHNNGGFLVNISDGGIGGDTFTNNPNKEDIRKKHKDSSLGDKNGMYGLKLEERPSHIAKVNGNHWNLGRQMSQKHKDTLQQLRYDRLPIVQKIDKNSFEIVDELKILDMVKKYDLSYNRLYFCLKNGGEHKGFYWKYEKKELVLKKTINPNYQRPKKNNKYKKVYFKSNFGDVEEIEYNNVLEASIDLGVCVETIRRKCRENNDTLNVFRYENSDYKIRNKKNKQISVVRVDDLGEEVIFNSITEASKSLTNGSISMIVQVCKGNRKKHKGFKFKYLK